MKGFFGIDVRDENAKKNIVEYRILFKAPGFVNGEILSEVITDGLRRVLFPDVLLVVSVPSETSFIEDLFRNHTDTKIAVRRAGKKVCITLCEISNAGKLINLKHIVNPPKTRLPLLQKKNYLAIYKEGLKKVLHAENVIVRSPAGFTFVKPSGEKSTLFLRTEEALYESERCHFIACCILSHLHERALRYSTQIETIYVDTMAISSVAYATRDLYCEIYKKHPPRIVSFHSYDEIESIEKPIPGTALCLISASTSMNMQRKWMEITKCATCEVITLLTAEGASDSEQAVHAIDLAIDSSDNKNLKDLRIVGERFAPEDTPIKQVMISTRHKQLKWASSAITYSDSKLFSLMRTPIESNRVRQVFVDGELLITQETFKLYVKKLLIQKVPLSVRTIIYQNDKASKNLAMLCKDIIDKKLKEKDWVTLVSGDSLSSKFKPASPEDAILIVAAVIGKGTKLLSISRDLRDVHIGARNYMVGFQITETLAESVHLQSNLVYSSIASNIQFDFFDRLAIGSSLKESFDSELVFLQRYIHRKTEPDISKRINILLRNKGITESAVLPSVPQSPGVLALRKDFAFWNKDYDESDDHSVSVVITAAFILQNARESSAIKNYNDRLASGAFQQVVLDPENFARFNDGVIQGALLRSAYPHELDYSSDENTSIRMQQILGEIFLQHRQQQGEAALEFGFALRSGKIKLAKKHLEEMQTKLRPKLNGKSKRLGLLRGLLGLDESIFETSPPI